MAQFSGTIKLTDLNDFIAPSQACVVSLQGAAPDAKPPAQLREEEGKVQLHAKPGGFKQTYTPGDKDDGPVKVSLHDCLACSGCVTSAETVLLQNQSVGELAAKLTEPGAVVVVSVSPQSRASLAAYHGLDAADVQARLTTALRRIGVAAVLDIGVAREMALAEAAEEFMQRYNAGTATPGAPGPLPMLASACPGWVCYAEKTQAANLLPHISSTKSPQAIMGSIVKRRLAPLRGWDPARVYHCSVMPCYDKKLEASREDFYLPGTRVPEVDSCLTTGELQQLLEGWDAGNLPDVPATALDTLLPASELQQQAQHKQQPGSGGWESAYALAPYAEPPLHGAPGSSGGYMEAVLRAAAARVWGPAAASSLLPPPGAPLPLKVVRNADFREIVLEPPQQPPGGPAAAAGGDSVSAAGGSGSGVGTAAVGLRPGSLRPLRFAAAYGFRNIQSLVRKVKLGRCEYDYVEVMACPGGCLNGGGQAKPRGGRSAAQLLDDLEELYYTAAEGQAQAHQCGGTDAAPSETCAKQPAGCCGGSGADSACAGPGHGASGPMDVDCHYTSGHTSSSSNGGVAAATPAVVPAAFNWQPALSATARALYRDWVGAGPGSAAAVELLHTAYHHREKSALGTVGDW